MTYAILRPALTSKWKIVFFGNFDPVERTLKINCFQKYFTCDVFVTNGTIWGGEKTKNKFRKLRDSPVNTYNYLYNTYSIHYPVGSLQLHIIPGTNIITLDHQYHHKVEMTLIIIRHTLLSRSVCCMRVYVGVCSTMWCVCVCSGASGGGPEARADGVQVDLTCTCSHHRRAQTMMAGLPMAGKLLSDWPVDTGLLRRAVWPDGRRRGTELRSGFCIGAGWSDKGICS